MPHLSVLPEAEGKAAAAIVVSLGDSLRMLAGLRPGQSLSQRAESLVVQLERDLRLQRRATPRWEAGFSRAIRGRVAWQSAAVLTVGTEASAFTGGAHG
jgi:hypothetical protein